MGRLPGVTLVPHPQELARLQGPVPKPPDPPRTKKTQRRGWCRLWIDKINKSGGVKLKHEGLWSHLQKKFLASTGNELGSLES